MRLHSAIGYITPADRQDAIWAERDLKLCETREVRRRAQGASLLHLGTGELATDVHPSKVSPEARPTLGSDPCTPGDSNTAGLGGGEATQGDLLLHPSSSMQVPIMFLTAIASVLLCSCDRGTPEPAALSRHLLTHQPPRWTEHNIGVQGQISQWRVSSDVAESAPFAKGRSLVGLVEGVWDGERGGGYALKLYQDFGDFKNSFMYVDTNSPYFAESPLASKFYQQPLIYGARTTNPSGGLLAESRLLEIIKPENGPVKELIIEEFHFAPNGGVTFYCKSAISAKTRHKMREFETIGTKVMDYYFVHPILGGRP